VIEGGEIKALSQNKDQGRSVVSTAFFHAELLNRMNRLERLRLPSSLLIENHLESSSSHPAPYCSTRFRSRLATNRKQKRIYTGSVKFRVLTFVLVIGITTSPPPAQSADMSAEQTTVCDIVNHPSQFIGKTVKVRAQIWPDSRYPNFFWMNESSPQFGTVCRFLQASFKNESSLEGQTAFGTFSGRIVRKLYHQKSTLLVPDPKELPLILLVDQ
jgi:hypothetical protein